MTDAFVFLSNWITIPDASREAMVLVRRATMRVAGRIPDAYEQSLLHEELTSRLNRIVALSRGTPGQPGLQWEQDAARGVLQRCRVAALP